MREPENKKEFYEENRDKTFFYLSSRCKNIGEIKEVKPDYYYNMILWYYPQKDITDIKKITKFNADWFDIFETKEAAEEAFKYYSSLYGMFKYRPYLSIKMLINHAEQLHKIEQDIEEGLKDNENFEGVDFCDVSAGGIQIRIHHKEIKNYTYGGQYTILYDFSNADDAAQAVIEHFKEIDNPKDIKIMLDFIADGEKYGWD